MDAKSSTSCLLPVLLLGCAGLAGVDEYEVRDTPGGSAAPEACSGATEVREPGGECVQTGVLNCLDAPGWTPDSRGGCSYRLACARGLESTDELQLPSSCHRFGCTPPAQAANWVVDSRNPGSGPGQGTEVDPFVSIQTAVDHAQSGQTIFVRGGQYSENVVIDKPIFLDGRCPTLDVIVRALDPLKPVLTVVAGAAPPSASDLVSIDGLRIEGGSAGVRVEGGPQTNLSELWIEGAEGPGIEIRARQHPVRILNLAVVGARGAGIAVLGSPAGDVDINGALVRGTSDDGRLGGHGLYASSAGAATSDFCDSGLSPLLVAVSNSIFEQTSGAAVFAEGTELLLTDSLVLPAENATQKGPALVARAEPAGRVRGSLQATRVFVDRVGGGGIDLFDLETAAIADTVVRGAEPSSDSACAASIRAESAPNRDSRQGWICPIPARPAMDLSISRVLVDGAALAGLMLVETPAHITQLLVRGTRSEPCSGRFGDGVAAYSLGAETVPVDLFASRIEHNARAGVAAFGSNVSVAGVELACNGAGIVGQRALPAAGRSACGCGAENRSLCVPVSAALDPALRGWQ